MKYAMIFIIVVFTLTTAAQTQHEAITNGFTEKNHLPLMISHGAKEFKNVSPEIIALNNSGVKNALLGNYREAINAFRQIMSKVPELPQVRYNLGTTLTYNKQYDEAIRILRDVIADNPDFASAHANLGETLYKNGSFTESIKSLRQALKLNPSDTSAMVNLGSLRWFNKSGTKTLYG